MAFDLMKELAAAAARGVEVTVLTNDRSAPVLTLRWEFKTYNTHATGTFRGAGYDLYVIDKDGDASEWRLRRGKAVIAEGETYEWQPFYHFDACLLAAEAALRAEVARRKAEIAGAP